MEPDQRSDERIVIIGGCGHVGLPLGLALARSGKQVVAIDLDQAKVDATNAGAMPFLDHGAEELLQECREAGSFRCTTDFAEVSEADVLVSVIGTPVDLHLSPEFDVIWNLMDQLEPHLRPGQLLIMRSTLFPGTTARVEAYLKRKQIDLDLAFCPERVAQGHSLTEISEIPQIIAGCTDRAQRRCEALFARIAKETIPLPPLGAELTKLYNNAWRYISFAVANQFYMIAEASGLDFEAIRDAMTRGNKRAADFPRPGFTAGPCLFKDTMQLAAYNHNHFFLGHSAMLVNEGMPDFLVRLAARDHKLEKLTVGILGMTFKADNDDLRDSLSLKLQKILKGVAAEVLCADVYVQEDWITPLHEVLERSDLLFIGVPHREYRALDFGDTPVIDIWNMAPTGATTQGSPPPPRAQARG